MIDLQLIEQCRGGNFNNFRKLVELTSPFAYSVAFRILGNEDQAKDVVQETMVTIWQKLKKIKTPEVYKTWIYRIVVNKCYDEMRKRKRNPEFVTDDHTWELISNRISERDLLKLHTRIQQMSWLIIFSIQRKRRTEKIGSHRSMHRIQ